MQAVCCSFKIWLRGGKVGIRLAHNQKIAGATPASATNTHGDGGRCRHINRRTHNESPAVLVKPSYALPECLHRTGRTGDSRSPTIFFAGVNTTPISCDTVCSARCGNQAKRKPLDKTPTPHGVASPKKGCFSTGVFSNGFFFVCTFRTQPYSARQQGPQVGPLGRKPRHGMTYV